MYVSLLHLNRLLEDDIPFKTEVRVRLVDDEDLAQVEFRNTLTHTDRRGLLCRFHLTLPSRRMPRAVSITYHFIILPRSKSFSVCQTFLSRTTSLKHIVYTRRAFIWRFHDFSNRGQPLVLQL